ncbi:unnamed protein product [Ilex paraguariensis]|uniref:PPM-type phosphatase domain-containing protein n=1 Tax=Ilex paraguariensis TaxID=185542 RepID=A0ABC8R7F8_9AQUA
MADESNSVCLNEDPNVESNNKRDIDFNEEHSVSKKLKSDGQEENKPQVLDEGIVKESEVCNGDGSSERKGLAHNDRSEVNFVIEADVAEDKGSRHTMEDAWAVLPDASLEFPGKLRCAHYSIYDGHGGRLAAEFAQKHLHANVLSAGLPLGCKSCQKGNT